MSQLYDAVVVVSFGGPESREEVMPFLENVLRGRNVPQNRMMEVADHYYHFNGVSPINQQNRELIAALEKELSQKGPRLPIYWGNRNWHPFLSDTVRRMAQDGIRRALAFVTSAYASYSGCRQYREDIQKARQGAGQSAPKIDKIRNFFNHPGFIHANADMVRKAYAALPESEREAAPLLFSAHSIPLGMADKCQYVQQLNETSRLVGEHAGRRKWTLVYQSRSGSPRQPWLEPDITEWVRKLAGEGVKSVVVAPIGFVSDHMEVLYDLDTELKAACDELGVRLSRAGTVGTHPFFTGMIRELILERMNHSPVRRFLGDMGPAPDFCPVDCCPPQ